MKVSFNWLKEYVDCGLSPAELADRLTMAGLEVEGVVLCDQVKSLDWKARHARTIGALPGRSVKEIQARILALIQ